MTQWTADMTPFRDAFLELEAAASAAYNGFVYQDAQQCEDVRALLFDRGVAEFGSPHVSAIVGSGVLEAFICLLGAQDLGRARMRSALAIAKAGFFTADPDLHRRMQLAGTTNAAVEDGDYYISRVAVSPAFAGRGRASQLLNEAGAVAAAAGARRLVLEVASGNEVALALYRKHGFAERGLREVTDPLTSRSLALIHMAKAV